MEPSFQDNNPPTSNVPPNSNPIPSLQNQDTQAYVEEMKRGSYNILVTIRCRPLSPKEKEQNPKETLKIMNRKVVILLDPTSSTSISNLNNNPRNRDQTMAFDFAFDKTETQEQVFTCTTKFLLDGVVNGYNATVFAYGATGAGKTYTMLGTEEHPGIMPLTLEELFNKIASYKDRDYTVKLWYLEIYNENIRDLLSNSDEYLDLREDPNKGVIVSGITEITATSSKHVLGVLKKGNKNRTTESTNANETSSRSHAILQIMVSYKDKNEGIDYEIKYGKLSLIDLAGSERASATLNRGIRLIEGANINRSLLTLGNCINALCEANEKGTKTYVPYRDSKLTRLLKDSLGGNARTVMIANVSPFTGTYDDTYNTLKYANRAKNIKTNIHRNVLNAQHHITNYVNIIKNLQQRINELESQISRKREMTASPKLRNYTNNQHHTIETTNANNANANGNSNSNNSNTIAKSIDSLLKLCDDTMKLKQKVTLEQNEMLRLINNIKHEETNYTSSQSEDEDKRVKASNLKRQCDMKLLKIKENNDAIEHSYTNILNNYSLSQLHKDYIQLIIKHHKHKVNAYDKEQLIHKLVLQIQIRDMIIRQHNIQYECFDKEIKEKYVQLRRIQKENPFLLSKCKQLKNETNTSYNEDTQFQLPKLANHAVYNANNNTTTITSLLSDVREMNNNLNIKLKHIQQRDGVNSVTNKAKEIEVNTMSPREKKKMMRNYSNNIRNINSANSTTNNNVFANRTNFPHHKLKSIYSNKQYNIVPQKSTSKQKHNNNSGSQREINNFINEAKTVLHNDSIGDNYVNTVNNNSHVNNHNNSSLLDVTDQSIVSVSNNNNNIRNNHLNVDHRITEEGNDCNMSQDGYNNSNTETKSPLRNNYAIQYHKLLTEQNNNNNNMMVVGMNNCGFKKGSMSNVFNPSAPNKKRKAPFKL